MTQRLAVNKDGALLYNQYYNFNSRFKMHALLLYITTANMAEILAIVSLDRNRRQRVSAFLLTKDSWRADSVGSPDSEIDKLLD